MRRILVTGANGQLGNAMRLLGATSRNEYRFTDVAELDITDEEAVRRAVCDGRIDVIVNCAAYTTSTGPRRTRRQPIESTGWRWVIWHVRLRLRTPR